LRTGVLAAAVAGLAVAELTAAFAAPALHLSSRFALQSGAIFLAVMVIAARRVQAYHPHPRFGSANILTSIRLALVALMTAAVGEPHTPALAWAATAVALVASALDGADGWLARHSGLVSRFGARFDMETDALLIMALAVLAWRWERAGAWVLACGLMRYVFVASAWAWPWLSNPLPPSFRRKAVCVVQIVGLAIIVAPVMTPPLGVALAAATLAMLTWSFAVDVAWLYARRQTLGPPSGGPWSGRLKPAPTTKFFPDHQLQAGPHVVHGAHLHVHEPRRQRNLPDDVLGDVGFHLRRLLWPRHPHRGIGAHLRPQTGQHAPQRRSRGREHVHDVHRIRHALREGDAVRQRREPRAIA
jgi:phosphatidylglycerophosphate synthase